MGGTIKYGTCAGEKLLSRKIKLICIADVGSDWCWLTQGMTPCVLSWRSGEECHRYSSSILMGLSWLPQMEVWMLEYESLWNSNYGVCKLELCVSVMFTDVVIGTAYVISCFVFHHDG